MWQHRKTTHDQSRIARAWWAKGTNERNTCTFKINRHTCSDYFAERVRKCVQAAHSFLLVFSVAWRRTDFEMPSFEQSRMPFVEYANFLFGRAHKLCKFWFRNRYEFSRGTRSFNSCWWVWKVSGKCLNGLHLPEARKSAQTYYLFRYNLNEANETSLSSVKRVTV